MLQIITGKFFKTDKLHETPHRGTLYTNYLPNREVEFKAKFGRLLPSSNWEGGIPTLTYEVIEKLEAVTRDGRPEILVSVGGREIAHDLAAVISFALNITCTVDPDLTRRLIGPAPYSPNVRQSPSKYIRRTFDLALHGKSDDAKNLESFFDSLLRLKRGSYEAAIRAIRRYISGLHRIADDIDLAYVLLVMSIESLAQTSTTSIAKWSDYDESKRLPIDAILADARPDVADRLREAILRNEHIAIGRRFHDFALSHVATSFYRAEAHGIPRPARGPDLSRALKEAYKIRSRYVHRLQGVPKLISECFSNGAETFDEGRFRILTLQGLARLARHIISQFVIRADKVDTEDFNYRLALPNLIEMPLAAQYWVGDVKGFRPQHGNRRLEGLLEQITAVLQTHKDASLSDLNPLLEIYEGLFPTLPKNHRLSMLATYQLFNYLAPESHRRPQHREVIERYESDFLTPSIENFLVYFICDVSLPWNRSELENIHAEYFQQRNHKNGINIGPLFETALILSIAETTRKDGDETRARELLALAIESSPNFQTLMALEQETNDQLPEINPREILIQNAELRSTDAASTTR